MTPWKNGKFHPVKLGEHILKESYNWITPEMTMDKDEGDKVVIRGPALFSVEKHFKKGISKNMRRYIQDEVIRSARTLEKIPMDVNHAISVWEEKGKRGPKPHYVGHVRRGEEEDGRVEYVAEINDNEYVEKIRDTVQVRKNYMTKEQYHNKWGKDPLLGVSVDAEFTHLLCKQCDRKFYSTWEYKSHMKELHLLKDVTVEPRGIRFKRLSLVEPPEALGVSDANFEIVETAKHMTQLLETVRRYKLEKDEYNLKEQAENHGCKDDEHWSEEKQACIPNQAQEQEAPSPPCPEGWHEVEGNKCAKDEVTEQEGHGCADDEVWSEDQQKCVKKPEEKPQPTTEIAALREQLADEQLSHSQIRAGIREVCRIFQEDKENQEKINKEFKQAIAELKEKKVSETQSLHARVDNIEHRIKGGQFQGSQAGPQGQQKDQPITQDPIIAARRKKKR